MVLPLLLPFVLFVSQLAPSRNPGRYADFEAEVGGKAPDWHLITDNNQKKALSDWKGKWVLLQLGTTWLPESEALTLVGSDIRQNLEGYPFEFVQVYDEPSVCDAALYGFTQSFGVHAVIERRRHPNFFRDRKLPAWSLIDPDGVLRAAGEYDAPDRIRETITQAWQSDPRMKKAPIVASRLQASSEEMVELYDSSNFQPMIDVAESILAEDPGHEVALRFLLHGLLYKVGFSQANKLLASGRYES